MERYIYCPSNELLEKAITLFNKTKLPVLIGDNENTKNLQFERDLIQILEVPHKKFVYLVSNPVKVPFHQNIEYINEFKKLKNKTYLYINNELVKPLFEEAHRIYWNYQCIEDGLKNGKIFIDGAQEEEFSFYAVK